MSTLNANLARPFYCKLRYEYCFDFEDHTDELVECLVFAVTSIPHRAITFSALLDNGALWSHLPISAFCWLESAPHLPIPNLEPWDAFGYDVSVIEYEALRELSVSILGSPVQGEYMQTIDWYGNFYSQTPDQAKQAHLIKRDDGTFGLYPGNRLVFLEKSFVTKPLESNPGFKAQTRVWHAE